MRALLLALALAAGCAPDNPLKISLDAYEDGVAALEAGRNAEAAADFRAALAATPRSAELQLWLGRALAADGDYEGAIAAATAALELRGTWSLAHYNRACWRVRSGDLESAALDLSIALEDGDLDRLSVAADTDLDPLRADPRYRSRVPARQLPAAVEAPAEPVFLGSEWQVRLAATTPPGAPLEVLTDSAPPPAMRWVKSVQDGQPVGTMAAVIVDVVFRVEGAAAGSLGPWELSSGGLSATVGPAAYEFLAPEGREPPEAVAWSRPFRLPEVLVVGLETGARRDGDEIVVRAEPGDKVSWSPKVPSVQLEGRRAQQPQWIGRLLKSAEPVTVTITRGGAERYKETL